VWETEARVAQYVVLKHHLFLLFFSPFVKGGRETDTLGHAHSATMRAEGFLSLSFVGGGPSASPSFLCTRRARTPYGRVYIFLGDENENKINKFSAQPLAAVLPHQAG